MSKRRDFLKGLTAFSLAPGLPTSAAADTTDKAEIAITYDLEMSRHYPKRSNIEWDYQKGNLDQDTKNYSVAAAKIAADNGVHLHFFLVGRVLEQDDISWLHQIHEMGHVIGNHTYDHVNLLATTPSQTQFRFSRSPWLVKDKTVLEILRENIRLTEIALKQRAGINQIGFRTPGGFSNALTDRPDLQDLLLDLGFSWVSSKYPRHLATRGPQGVAQATFDNIVESQTDAQPFRYKSGLLEIPMSPISDVNAFRSNFWTLDEFTKAITYSIKAVIKEKQVYDFICHPSCMLVEDPQHKTLRTIIKLVKSNPDSARISTLDEIAQRFT
ncbi:MAG: chitin deacetylase [Planctomycetaceae bacterium]|nr:chitin deacetylase [Planctomycetaceae bacterium]